jgi:hypothetical protein
MAGDQRANAEKRPGRGVSGIHRLLRLNHRYKISAAMEMRNTSLRRVVS